MGTKIASGRSPFNSLTNFRPSDVETKQIPGSEERISDGDCLIGTDQPLATNLSSNSALGIFETFTGDHPASRVAGTDVTGACVAELRCFGGFSLCCGVGCVTCEPAGNNDASAPERNDSSNLGSTFRTSVEKQLPPPEGRADKGARRPERSLPTHALLQQRPQHEYNVQPMYRTRVGTRRES